MKSIVFSLVLNRMKNASHIIMIWHVLVLVLDGSDIKIALYCLWNRGSQVEPGIKYILKIFLREIHFDKAVFKCLENH